jgi:type II restriction enzyme
MPRQTRVQKLTAEALLILETLGIPLKGLTLRRQEKMAKVFLAVAGMKPGDLWSTAKDSTSNGGFNLQTRQIISFINLHLDEKISLGSYDDIRRKDLVLPVEAMLILASAKNPNANTNDGTRGFALNPDAASVIRTFGTDLWQNRVDFFLAQRPTLATELSRTREIARIPVTIKEGVNLSFSAGKHNLLQKNIIEELLPIFGHGAEILYVGDTENKRLYKDEEGLRSIQFFELAHEKLPDVVAYSADKGWLFLIEAVTTANPITELRLRTLKKLTESSSADVVYITAFPDRTTYRKFAHDIAWETEVWLADAPQHMIHFNGHKFIGPYK